MEFAKLERVTIKGTVALKIIQHIEETPITIRNQCGGALLGVPQENDNTLLITNCFPYIEDTIDPLIHYKHMKEMYNEVFPVGWYLNCEYYSGLADVINHNKTCNGILSFRALRLTTNALNLIETGRFNSEFINQNNVDLDNYFEDLMIDYINSPLTNLLIAELGMKNQLPLNDPKYLKCQKINDFTLMFDVISQLFENMYEILNKTTTLIDDKRQYFEQSTLNRKRQNFEQEITQALTCYKNMDKKNFFNCIYTTDFYNASIHDDLQCIYEKFESIRSILLGEKTD